MNILLYLFIVNWQKNHFSFFKSCMIMKSRLTYFFFTLKWFFMCCIHFSIKKNMKINRWLLSKCNPCIVWTNKLVCSKATYPDSLFYFVSLTSLSTLLPSCLFYTCISYSLSLSLTLTLAVLLYITVAVRHHTVLRGKVLAAVLLSMIPLSLFLNILFFHGLFTFSRL